MRSLKIIIPAILFLLLVVGGIYTIYQAQVTPKDNLVTTTLPTPKNNFPKATATAKPQVNGASNLTSQPSTGPEDGIEVQNIGIRLNNISSGQQIASPFILTGIANITSQTVTIKVHDNIGNILTEGRATACLSLSGCNFEASLAFQKPQVQRGYIEVYSSSTVNGEHLYLHTIPIHF